jgi:hypothetical protein
MDDDLEKENDTGNVDLNFKAQNGQHLNKIVKLQKADKILLSVIV